ncbi:uncharacterized protein BCR38DRAFT_421006 [Pseudomassariella vexata]|uniref:WD40-repeat-containing domain protein n=1 Tax=Pseudomassariella vexata TaxID=1141098 RepID=A0A1Y2EEV7_9PEZI|nr:uncharacterized protein BCR38DRAFT_421006 [Pseudomassariella vexata]ORY70101.1 hypothetical protein BCR38DRAFT_421006 [Pseudomassariella vexata]
MPAKKKDKNAKDSGGVVAAVTKHAAKFSNGNANEPSPAMPESPPNSDSPDMQPATPASIPTNGVSATEASPLLDAVSGTSVATSTAPSEWAKNHGVFAGSPNLISLMGESPPTQPSSYEDQRVSPYTWNGQRPFANSQGYSASPPTGSRRPLSFQMDAHYAANDVRSQASSPPGARRSSMHSPFAQPRVGGQPPLPHQPQAHFYGAPDIDFDLNPKSGLKAGERGYYFGFDTWPAPSGAISLGISTVALAGYEGGLDIYSVSKRGVELLTSLKGLRGGVYNAKILPWNGVGDQYGLFPLIAVVVHGPVMPTPPAPEISGETHYDAGTSPKMDGINTPQSDTNQRLIGGGKSAPAVEAYQTTVEVYSLRTNRPVGTLLQASRIPFKTSTTNPAFRRPPPTGAFQIRADDGTVVVSSGTTGECWVYRQFLCELEPGFEFRCVGKIWTTLQQARKGDSTPEEDRSRSPVPPRQSPQTPIVAMSGRWLAYCPPAPSSQIALNAVIGVPAEGKAPGLATLTSPVLPSESSEVDQPISDGVMNKIMRETTQEVIQGARWVGKQGMQLWNNYWKQPGPAPQSRTPAIGSPPGWAASYAGRTDASQFPPTYGVSGQAVTKDPGLVSILDLESLENSTSIHHVTTFKTPLGCSFLSLSPTGLSLFTASSKGDVQTVWDLMRIQYSKSSALQNSQPNNGHTTRVRQIAQFSRMTVARIVEVAWAKPNGERVAMVTERGTVHLLDMPPSAYTWPPPRRRAKAQESGAGGAENAPSAASIASTALTSAYDAARPLINRQSRSSSNTQNASSIMDHASYGGKFIAAGISHSLGNAGTAINQLRQQGENRVSLPMTNATPGISCVTWTTGKRSHTLYVAGAGLVRSFPSKTRKTTSGKDRPRIPCGNRYKDYKLEALPDDMIAPVIRRIVDDEDLDLINPDLDGGNPLVFNTRQRLSGSDLGPESSIPQAEIESSAPYQPFHTDRRVALYEYGIDPVKSSLITITQLLDATTLDENVSPARTKKRHQPKPSGKQQAWAFGQKIDAVKVDVGLVVTEEVDFINGTDDHRALPASAIERVLQVGDNDEQIVVTTRRRRGGNRASDLDEDGFFEDDCEVLDFADQRV